MAGRPQLGTVPRGLPRNDPAFTAERARRRLDARAARSRAAKVRRRARGGAGNHFDPDDPEFESLIRQYAEHVGEDPDKVLEGELAAHGRTRRKGAGSINYLSEPGPDDAGAGAAPGPPAPVSAGYGLTVGDASGFMLGFLLWGWVVLPWVTANEGVSGPDAVRNVWRAKWLNKSPSGDRLMGGRPGVSTPAPASGPDRWQA